MDLNQAKYSNITADTTVKSGGGTLYGIVVNSHTSGTIKIWDNTASSGTVVINTYTFATGSQTIMFPMGVSFYTGLRCDIGGTVDLTILYS